MQYDFRADQLLMLEHQMTNDINVLSTTCPSYEVENAEEKNSVSKQQVLNTLEIINYKQPIQRIIRNTIFITKIIFTGLSIFTGLCIFAGLCILIVRNS